MKNSKASKNYSLSYPKIVALGFALIIIIGTGLLMLPISSKADGSVSLINAFFTATSATCVTGLVPFDTYSTWSVFGQIVLLCLIQIGGLGFITVIAFLFGFVKKKVSLKEKILLKDSVGSLNIGDVKELVKSVIILTALTEIAGAIILSTRMIPLCGIKRGIYISIFTSVSAYCNAGFDLMGFNLPSSSLTTVNSDPVIIITVALLILIGGLGFIVWQDIRDCKGKFSLFNVHTKLVVITTATLLVLGTVLYFVFERGNTLKDMSLPTAILNAFFTNVTTRTAGFNSVDTGSMTAVSKVITIMFMFIGGSSGSTAGGVKTTTIAILIISTIATLKNKDEVNIFGKRIEPQIIKKAVSVAMINLFEIIVASFIISSIQGELSFIDVVFECGSAIGTVGMTAGITTKLCLASKLIIIALMYIGRLTSLIFALMFAVTKAKTTTQKPKGIVIVG